MLFLVVTKVHDEMTKAKKVVNILIKVKSKLAISPSSISNPSTAIVTNNSIILIIDS